MKKSLLISTSLDLVRIAPERIVYIASDGNYSTMVQTDNEVRMLSYQLGQMEKMISSQLGSEGVSYKSYSNIIETYRSDYSDKVKALLRRYRRLAVI